MKTFFLLAGLAALAVAPLRAQTDASAPVQSALVGRSAKRWVIAHRYWTNTPRPVWLGGLQGHVTVLDFFRIGCIHCEEAAPARRALFDKFALRGVKMIGFQSPGNFMDATNPENNWSQVKATIKRWNLPYPIAFDDKRQLFNSYKLQLFPTVLVLDAKGIVRFEQSGYSPEKAKELEQAVQRLLDESKKS